MEEDWLYRSDDDTDMLFDNHSQDTNLFEYDNELFSDDASEGSDILFDDMDTRHSPSETSLGYAVLPAETSRRRAIDRIENLLESITDSVLNDPSDLSIEMPKRSASATNDIRNSETGSQARRICFPGKSKREARLFTSTLRVLELMHAALVERTVTSKRDIFYKDPALFGNQTVVDRIVDDVACSFELPRSSLNVVAAAKGLVAGSITISRGQEVVLDGLKDCQGALIPILKSEDVIDVSTAQWILLVEKDAAFQTLLSSPAFSQLMRRGILITGKGYPDIATRALLHRLAALNQSAPLPIHGLFDCDPDGIAILCTYKFGSATLSHQNDTLVVPSIHWLGLKTNDMTMGNIRDMSQALLPLSMRDRKKAAQMLDWAILNISGDGLEMRRELQTMLMLNLKAEIQVLDDSGTLQSWLEAQFEI